MVSGSSPARKAGVNVYSDGTAYYVAMDKEESSFRNLSTRKTVKTKPAGAVLVGDLFGEPRVAGKFTLGALQQTGSKGLVIVIE